MKMTDRELRDVVAVSIIGYFEEVKGERLADDEYGALAKWVDAEDFEETLEVIRANSI